MLKQLRQKKVMKRVLWVLAIIIIPAFVLWGAGGIRGSANYAGMVFGRRVTLAEYRESFNAVKNRALLIYGSNFYNMQDKLDLETAAWNRLVMLREAENKKIKASDNEVIAKIATFPFFRGKDGSFSPEAYSYILRNTFRTEPRNFEEEMRQSIMIEKLIKEVTKNIPEPTDDEIEEALNKEKEKEEVKKEGKEEKKEEEKEEGSEDRETPPKDRREQVKNELLMKKKAAAYQNWRMDLYQRARPTSRLKRAEEKKEEKERSNDNDQTTK